MVVTWLSQNVLDLVSTVGIIATLFFTGADFLADGKARKLENLIAFTGRRDGLWQTALQDPLLARIGKDNVDLVVAPVTDAENEFVLRLLLHLHNWFRAVEMGEVVEIKSVEVDVKSFFSLPVPNQVWTHKKGFFEQDFVQFVDGCRNRGTVGKMHRIPTI